MATGHVEKAKRRKSKEADLTPQLDTVQAKNVKSYQSSIEELEWMLKIGCVQPTEEKILQLLSEAKKIKKTYRSVFIYWEPDGSFVITNQERKNLIKAKE